MRGGGRRRGYAAIDPRRTSRRRVQRRRIAVLDAPNVKVHPAGIQDRDGGKMVLKADVLGAVTERGKSLSTGPRVIAP